MAAGVFLAARKFSVVNDGLNNSSCGLWFWCLDGIWLVFVALDECAFLTHLNLDGSGFARGVSLFDFTGRFFDQGDFFAFGRSGTVAGL